MAAKTKFNTQHQQYARHKTAPQGCPNRPTGQKADHLLAKFLSNGITKSVRTATSQQNAAMSAPCGILEPLAPAAPRSRHAHRARCPLSHKEEAKALGAKWDRTKKIWYVPSGVNPEPFAEWLPGVDRSDPSAPYIYLVLGKRECWKCHKETSVAPRHSLSNLDNDEKHRQSRTRPTKPGTLPSTRPMPTRLPSCPLLAACRARSATTFISAAATNP